MCFAVFIQPFDTSIYSVLFILHGDLFDFAVREIFDVVEVVLTVSAFQLAQLCIFANKAEPVM